VAIGIALDARYSVLVGLLPEGEELRVARLLERLGFRLWDEALNLGDERGTRRVLAGLKDFQEHLGGELTITLLAGIGRGVEVHSMDEALIQQSIKWLRTRARLARGS
jgi:3-dehydroquinate synthase